MDVPLFIIILLLICSVFISFLSTVLSYLSQDDLNNIIEQEHPNARKLHKLWLRFDEHFNPFIFIEALGYATATILLGYELGYYREDLMTIVTQFAVFAGVIVLLRIASYIIGVKLSKRVALHITPLYEFLFTLMGPIQIFYDKLTAKIRGMNPEDASREEISALVESARDEGSLDDDEYRILKNIMNFSEVLVSDVMTPRTVLFTLESDDIIKDSYKYSELNQYSRVPVWKSGSNDEEILGYVLSKDILIAALNDEMDKTIGELTREVNLINEETRLDKALEEFLRRRKHMFIVVDEYGGVEGLISMEDVLETILGVEIVDEGDKVADLRVLAKQKRDKRIRKKQEEDED